MHSHFNNSTYMYILPHLPRLPGAPHIDSVPVPPVCSLAIVILLLLFNYLLLLLLILGGIFLKTALLVKGLQVSISL